MLLNLPLLHWCFIFLVSVGYAKNAAIRASSGEYLCFLDSVRVNGKVYWVFSLYARACVHVRACVDMHSSWSGCLSIY